MSILCLCSLTSAQIAYQEGWESYSKDTTYPNGWKQPSGEDLNDPYIDDGSEGISPFEDSKLLYTYGTNNDEGIMYYKNLSRNFEQPVNVSFAWYETSYSFGGGITIHDSSGSIMAGTGTNNPGQRVFNGSSDASISGGQYDKWFNFTAEFLANGSYRLYRNNNNIGVYNTGGSGSRKISQIGICGANGGDLLASDCKNFNDPTQGNIYSKRVEMGWDGIMIKKDVDGKIVDWFEDGDYTKGPSWYKEYDQDGGTFHWSVSTDNPYEGNYALKNTNNMNLWDEEGIALDVPGVAGNYSLYLQANEKTRPIFEIRDSDSDSVSFANRKGEKSGDQIYSCSGSTTFSSHFSKSSYQKLVMDVSLTGDTVLYAYKPDGSLRFKKNVGNCIDDPQKIVLHTKNEHSDNIYFDNVKIPEISNSAPNVESYNFEPSVWSSSESVDLTANVTDDSSVDSVSARIYKDGDKQLETALTQEPNGNWTVSNLFTADSGDVEYKVELNATDGSGRSTVQNVTSKTTGNLSLTWSHPENPDGFKIYSNATGGMSQIADVSSSNYEHVSTALTSGKYVCYEVTAYNQYGESNPISDCDNV